MGIVCSLAGHLPSSRTVWNEGYHFATCTRCGVHLIEDEDGAWITPPPGYRIVTMTRELRAKLKGQGTGRGREAIAEDTPPRQSPIQEKRKGADRRVNPSGLLPEFLGGIDRRRSRDRRKAESFRPNRRKGLLAE